MIILVRVNHRLLHGQVVFTWTKSISTDYTLVTSDAVVKDELGMIALRSSKPNGVKLVMKSIDDPIKVLSAGVTDKYNLIILCENIEDVSRLAFGYDKITSINLGGIKNEAGKCQISKALLVNDEEIESLKKLSDKGIELEVRMVPNDSKQDVMTLI